MKFQENRAGQGDVETMLAPNSVLAGVIDPGFFVEIGFSGQREDSLLRVIATLVGVNMNGERLSTALLTSPASGWTRQIHFSAAESLAR